ncbi:hypothetical protein [Magnetospirillum sp. 64-120]|uniref:hypothetical protein n=1 Tax=Magnetospirillum sp. 64-120 TaxID=1895778 RepID=UPI00092B28DB|nr:hypothetical protein [Magnetospirillum sp. 64-120]OJX80898.1 MAG: hypothetical protein BGO92_07295 [Magnetospirillum sp. 64-120]
MLMERTLTKASGLTSSVAGDRRLNQRHDGAGLLVEIEGNVYPVVNVSTGGLCLQGLNRKDGERFRFVLSRLGNPDGITGECEVLGCSGELVHLVFTRPTLPLLRLIVAHVSALIGVKPHLLKSR